MLDNSPALPTAASILPLEETLEIRLQCLIVAAIAFLLSARLDGFPQDNTQWIFQLSLIPYTGGLLWLGWLFFRSELLYHWLKRFFPPALRLIERSRLSQLNFIVVLGFELITLGLLFFQNSFFGRFGYKLNLPLTGLVFLLVFGGAFAVFRQNARPVYGLWFVVFAYGLVQVLTIISFPLNPNRSDLLPLIAGADTNFLHGLAPYTNYTLESGTLPLTYLPGTWLAYLPVVGLGGDPRLLNLLLVVASLLLVYYGSAPASPAKALFMLSIFAFNPYFQYRHEIYYAPLWLMLAACFGLLNRRKPLLALVFLAFAITMTQFAWIIAPFILGHIFKTYRWRTAAGSCLIISAICTVIIGPFILWTPEAFFYGVLTHWNESNSFSARTANLSYFVSKIISVRNLQIVQAVVVLSVLALSAGRLKSLGECLKWAIVALTLFIIFNILIWSYFYLTIIWLLILASLTLGKEAQVASSA